MVVLPVGCMAFIYCWLQMVVACRVLAADPAADAAITNVVFMGECAALRCGERQLCSLEMLYWWMAWPFTCCGILSASLTTPFLDHTWIVSRRGNQQHCCFCCVLSVILPGCTVVASCLFGGFTFATFVIGRPEAV